MPMDQDLRIAERVHDFYWKDDLNCATTVFRILAECEGMAVPAQVLDAAAGMHGAGGHGAQCGLVEGPLMFLGLWGTSQGWSRAEVASHCRAYAGAFEASFGSLQCRVLRPQGFGPDQPPHLCEHLTLQAATFAADFMASRRLP